MAFAEAAASFCRAAAKPELSEAVIFDQAAWRAMSRVNAAHTASWVANEGLNLVAGCSEGDSEELAAKIDFKAVAKARRAPSRAWT